AGIPLTAWWRRTALAWVLQSPELTRAETDGLVLLWRRDVAERLGRLAPFAHFDVPVPVVADGALWWIAYGYVGGEAFPLARPVAGGPGATRLWMALGFEAGPRGEVAGLLAGTIAAAGPRLALWRPSQATRLPGSVLGSPQTAPGVPRLWLAGGALVSAQALFAQAATDGEAPRVQKLYLTWG